ncbi:MAG: hypothetical protein ACI9LX_000134 [Paraglaciecola sp.]|jgi:hypothetical protein
MYKRSLEIIKSELLALLCINEQMKLNLALRIPQNMDLVLNWGLNLHHSE